MNIFVERGLDLEVVLNCIFGDKASRSRTVAITLSVAQLICVHVFLGMQPNSVEILIIRS